MTMFVVRRNFSLIQYRTYVKWLKRKAVRVLTSEESEQLHSSRRKPPAPKPSTDAKTVGKLVSGVIQNNVKFETLNVGDQRFGPVVTAAKSVVGREKRKIILLEGQRLVTEAVQTSQQIKSIFFTDAELLQSFPVESLAEAGAKFFKVKKDHMNLWSDTVAPQGIMAVCRQQTRSNLREATAENMLLPLTLICDNIKDAGTLGTLIRSAAAACCKTVLITRGCVDAWEPKVLRSGAGAHFHSHSIVTQVAWEQVGSYLSEEAELLVVSSSSLEVNRADRLETNTGTKKRKHVNVTSDQLSLSPVNFRMINCSVTDVVLLVSSGLTADAHQFAAGLDGKRISFPTIDGKDVMNAAVSGSVALFEIARQLRLQAAHTFDTVNETGTTSS